MGHYRAEKRPNKLTNLSPDSIAISYATGNWQVKLWWICYESPNSPKFSAAKISLYVVALTAATASEWRLIFSHWKLLSLVHLSIVHITINWPCRGLSRRVEVRMVICLSRSCFRSTAESYRYWSNTTDRIEQHWLALDNIKHRGGRVLSNSQHKSSVDGTQ